MGSCVVPVETVIHVLLVYYVYYVLGRNRVDVTGLAGTVDVGPIRCAAAPVWINLLQVLPPPYSTTEEPDTFALMVESLARDMVDEIA